MTGAGGPSGPRDGPATDGAGRGRGRYAFRPLATLEACRECVELQKRTWGAGFDDLIPASFLLVTHEAGGVVTGAYDADDRLAGFVFSIAGRRDDEPIHWSHMLAVRPEARGHGLGRALKLEQRERVLADGIGTIWWTFDPLVAANAHLNLARLGVEVAEYVPDLYGTETGSPLHGHSTDRLVVRWRLDSPRTADALAGRPPGRARAEALRLPAVTAPAAAGGEGGDRDAPLPDGPAVRLPAPARPPRGEAIAGWRAVTRRAFLHYLESGYAVEGFHRPGEDDPSGWYVLSKEERGEEV